MPTLARWSKRRNFLVLAVALLSMTHDRADSTHSYRIHLLSISTVTVPQNDYSGVQGHPSRFWSIVGCTCVAGKPPSLWPQANFPRFSSALAYRRVFTVTVPIPFKLDSKGPRPLLVHTRVRQKEGGTRA